jgi:hypothetical protein
MQLSNTTAERRECGGLKDWAAAFFLCLTAEATNCDSLFGKPAARPVAIYETESVYRRECDPSHMTGLAVCLQPQK